MAGEMSPAVWLRVSDYGNFENSADIANGILPVSTWTCASRGLGLEIRGHFYCVRACPCRAQGKVEDAVAYRNMPALVASVSTCDAQEGSQRSRKRSTGNSTSFAITTPVATMALTVKSHQPADLSRSPYSSMKGCCQRYTEYEYLPKRARALIAGFFDCGRPAAQITIREKPR